MKLTVIDAGNFKLDGGAMFGVVPKSIWQKLNPADENNMCSWNMRCLLIEDNDKLILIDTGIGDKQPQKWQNYYYRFGTNLSKSLKNAGYHESEITDVILTHLHIDHCGGAVKWNENQDDYELTFPNANYWTHTAHWNSALNANPKEKATFLGENYQIIKDKNALRFIDNEESYFGPNLKFLYSDGHTEKMIMPLINYHGQEILFPSDCIPSSAHVHIPYVMAYDIRPLKTIEEKENILKKCVDNNWIIVFDHDLNFESARIEYTEKGYKAAHLGSLKELIAQHEN